MAEVTPGGAQEGHWRGHQDGSVRLAVGNASRRKDRAGPMGNPVAGSGRDRSDSFHGGGGRDGPLARFRQKDAEDSREGVVHGSHAVKAISGG